MMSVPYDIERWRECAESLSQCGRELAALGWTPATSSNFSQRIDAHYIAITISGRDKGRLGVDDIMVVDLDGAAVGSDHRPSAETRLHTQLYARDPALGCVLHTHSHHQTVASRLFAAEGKVRLAGYELLKAFRGFDTHDTELDLPVFANSQDMEVLSAAVERWLSESETAQTRGGQPVGSAYLIDGHGLYAWGRDMAETRRHLDAMEFLLGCSLDLRRLQA